MKNNKNISRIVVAFVAVVFMLPAVASAAWWNPFTWKIFNPSPTVKIDSVPTKTVALPVKESPKTNEQLSTEVESLKKEIQELKKTPTTAAPAPKKIVPVPKPTVQTKPIEQPVVVVPRVPVCTDTEASGFSEANQKGWTTLITTLTTGEKCYYKKENGLWVRKSSQVELNDDTLIKQVETSMANIQSAMSALTQLESNCKNIVPASEAETARLRGLLGGADHEQILQKIYAQESYLRVAQSECVAKEIAAIDNLIPELRAALRIPNLPSATASLVNQLLDTMVLKRQRFVDFQYQSALRQ